MKISRGFVAALIAAVALIGASGATAQAAPFTISVDNAILEMGDVSGVRAIDSELEPPDPPATLSGDLTDGVVEIPKAGFVFPTKSAEVAPGINADIDMEANEDISGTFQSDTGALTLEVSLKATVGVLGSSCVISPIGLTLSTENPRPYLGEPFAEGIEGAGVLSANWSALPPVTGGGSCGIVSQLIAGPGGIAMSHGVHDFKTCETNPDDPRCGDGPVVEPPKQAPMLNSAPPSSTDATTATFTFAAGSGETQPVDGFECRLDSGAFAACDGGTQSYNALTVGSHTFAVRARNQAGTGPAATYSWTVTQAQECPPGTKGTPPDCQPVRRARLANLKVQPRARAVRRGQRAVFRVRVRNAGNAAATGVRVCVAAPKRLVRVRRCARLGVIRPGTAKVAQFRVVVNRRARRGQRAVLRFRAASSNAGNRAGRAVIRIR